MRQNEEQKGTKHTIELHYDNIFPPNSNFWEAHSLENMCFEASNHFVPPWHQNMRTCSSLTLLGLGAVQVSKSCTRKLLHKNTFTF